MSQHFVKIKSVEKITHDTICILTEKPDNYKFIPGQATMIALDREGWKNKKRPFTFTSLPEDEYIEFTIKTYPEHDGTTDKMLEAKPGENLILFDVFGTIVYKGEGVFIAGGAGVTPFISILRYLHKNGITGSNMLIFANKTRADIIHREEFERMLGDRFLNILSEEDSGEYPYGFVTKEYLEEKIEDYNRYFYLCGPPVMIRKVENSLLELGVKREQIVKEVF
jgi:ferredoxin-NADP reductase